MNDQTRRTKMSTLEDDARSSNAHSDQQNSEHGLPPAAWGRAEDEDTACLRTRDTVSFGMEHENGLAAYLTGEYVNASCIPAANELAPRMLRLNLLFQRGQDDGKVDAIERGRVAVKTVLTQSPHLLTHATLTPYELFRALYSGGGEANSANRDLLEVDLLVVRLNGDDRLYKRNGERIDYPAHFNIVLMRRLFFLNRPTWFISAWNHLSDDFQRSYGRGLLDVTQLIQDHLVEVRFGNVEQDRVPTRHPSCLIVDPNTGKSRFLGSNTSALSDWYPEVSRQSRSQTSGVTDRRLPIARNYDLDRGVPFADWESNPDLADWYDAREREARDRARAAKQATNPGPTSILMRGEAAVQEMKDEYARRLQRRLAAERHGK